MRNLSIIIIFLISTGILTAQDTIPPNVYFYYPGDYAFFSCDSGVIIFKILDESPIDWMTSHLDMFVNASPPVVLAESLASPLDSFYYFYLPHSFSDGDSVRLSYLPIYDIWGNWRNANFYFYVDLSPPEISLITPSEGTLPNMNLFFRAQIADEMARINLDSSNVSLDVFGNNNWSSTFQFSSGYVIYFGDTLLVDVNSLGDISGGDTIRICVDAGDNAVGCGANRTDTCFTYDLPYTPPDIELVYPFDGAVLAPHCADSIIFIVNDVDSIAYIWITVGVDTYTITDPEISISGDTVLFNTSSAFDDDEYYNIIIHCTDIYDISSQYSFGIWFDTSSPFIVSITPASGSLITDTIITVGFQMVDYIAGIDPGSIALTIDGAPSVFDFDSTTGFMSFDLIFDDVIDTLDVILNICINGSDNPDYCTNNFDSCFALHYYIDIRSPEFFPPNGSVTACIDQSLAAALYSLGGIDSETVILTLINMTDGGTIADIQLSDPRFSHTRTPVPPFGVMDSFFFEPTPGFWPDGKYIQCSIYGYVHHSSHPGYYTYPWFFYTDFSPPYLESISPANGSVEFTPPDTMYFRFGDETAGVLETAIACSLLFNGVPFSIPFGALGRISGDTVALSLANYGINLSGCDSIRFCASAIDAVSPGFCGPNSMHDCIGFSLDCTYPSAEFISPEPNIVLSCSLQTIVFALDEDVNLDSSSIVIVINNDTIPFSDDRSTISPTGTLTFSPNTFWNDGDTISGYLLGLCDYVGNCSETVPFQFVFDNSPPNIETISPLPGAIVIDSLAPIVLQIYDDFTSLSSYGILGDFGGSFTTVAGSTYVFDPSGITVLGPEDTVFVEVWAADSAESCGFNADTFEYWFVVDAVGPRIVAIDSVIGEFTSCDNRCISFLFDDFLGLDTFAAEVYSSNESETLNFASPSLEITDSSIAYCPSEPYADGETVTVALISAPDIAGNPLFADSIIERFIVDLSPPYFESISPMSGDTLTTTVPNVIFTVHDSISGVNWENCSLEVDCSFDDTILHSSDDGIFISGDTIEISFSDIGIFLTGGDSARVCIWLSDAIFDTIAGCLSHSIDTCTIFYIDASPPTVAPARPGNGSITSCIDQSIDFVLADSEGVDWDTVVITVNEDTFSTDSIELMHIISSDTMRFIPSALYDNDTVDVCVIYARDTLMNEIEFPVCWTFFIDTISPVIVDEYPADGAIINNPLPSIWADVDDTITGYVHLDSFSIDGVWHIETGELIDTFSYSVFDSLADGEHTVCISIYDQPDFCTPNDTILCWSFDVDNTSPTVSVIPESILVSSCDSMEFSFTATDIDSVILENISSDCDFTYIVDFHDDTTLNIDGFVFAPAVDGTVWVEITIADSLGNRSIDSIFFAFDRTPPVVSFVSPTDGETIFTQSPTITVSASDENGIIPDSAYFVIGIDTFYYDSGEIDFSAGNFDIDLSGTSYELPERGFSTIIFGGVFDTISGNFDCSIYFAELESITVFIADDDTMPPIISSPEYDSAWCGGTVFPQWTIYDEQSNVDSAFLIVGEYNDFSIVETLALSEISTRIYRPDTALWFLTDTLWFVVCATDSDNDFGIGDDETTGCGDTIFIVCRKPYISIINDTLDFGEVCLLDSARILQFGIANPTGIGVNVFFEQSGDSVFSRVQDSAEIESNDTILFSIVFTPFEEQLYSGEIIVNLDENVDTVYLFGIGILCPLGFSVEPLVITPNGDGFYDSTVFTFPLRSDNKVEIFAKNLSLTRKIESGDIRIIWYGTDTNGNPCPPGPYIFIAKQNNKILGKGIIVIVR